MAHYWAGLGRECGRKNMPGRKDRIGLDEDMVREYIRTQEEEDESYEQLKLGV